MGQSPPSRSLFLEGKPPQEHAGFPSSESNEWGKTRLEPPEKAGGMCDAIAIHPAAWHLAASP
jgi:hypothetical protein